MRAIATQGINLFRALMIYLSPVLPRMSEAASQFLGKPIRSWSDAATPLLGVALNPYQPLATRLDPALVARLVQTPASPAPVAVSTIGINEFSKVQLRVARVVSASLVAGSDKLLQLNLDLGGEVRQVFSGIRSSYAPEQLLDRLVIVVANLEPRRMRFGVSAGMVLCASGADGGIFLLSADSGAQPGMKVS